MVDGVGPVYRMQICLTESQGDALKELAASRDTSMAHLVREAVDLLLRTTTSVGQVERERRALSAVGRMRNSDSGNT